MIGNVGTPTAVVTVPLANEEKTLLFAPFAGGPNLRNNPPDRYVINFRAGYAEETKTIIDALIDVVGLRPEEIAFFTQTDNSGFAMAEGTGTSRFERSRHDFPYRLRTQHARGRRRGGGSPDCSGRPARW